MIQPFILRRSKRDVEKQLPKKYEHILKCRLSSRQKSLYEDILTQPGWDICTTWIVWYQIWYHHHHGWIGLYTGSGVWRHAKNRIHTLYCKSGYLYLYEWLDSSLILIKICFMGVWQTSSKFFLCHWSFFLLIIFFLKYFEWCRSCH